MGKNLKDTCNWGDCYFSQLFDHVDQCPYYQVLHWTPSDGGQPYATKDCSSRRVMMMAQDLYSRFIGIQKASEQERNAVHRLTANLFSVIKTIVQDPDITFEILAEKMLEEDHGRD